MCIYRPGQRRLFYTDFSTNQILVANIDGTGSQVLMEDDLEVPGTNDLNDCVSWDVYW